MHMAQIDFATRQIAEVGAGMPYQEKAKLYKQMQSSGAALRDIDAQLEELDPSEGPSVATQAGRVANKLPGQVADAAGKTIDAIGTIPAVKATGEAVSDFWSAMTGNEEKPVEAPAGTPKSLLLETGAEEQAEKAKSSTTGEVKPQTQAQRNKIEKVNADLAATIADKKKIKRKQLIDYRKALRANILAKNMTVAQASANYNEVLKAMKTPPSKWKITMNANGDVLVARDDGYYRVDRAEDKGDPKLTRQEENDDQKRMTDWSHEMTGGKGKNPRAASELASLIDQARNVVGFRLNQPGSRAAIEGAYKMRENAVANATSAWGLQWIGTSPGDAKRENPSLAPFFAASLLGVGDAQKATDFAKQLAVINGNQKLTEADWADTQNMAQALANAGVSGKEAMGAIVTLRKEGVTGPAALNAIEEFDWSK